MAEPPKPAGRDGLLSKKVSSAHRARLPRASTSTIVVASRFVMVANSVLVFDQGRAVADLAGPGAAEIILFLARGRRMPEHDQRALVVMQLGQLVDETGIAG